MRLVQPTELEDEVPYQKIAHAEQEVADAQADLQEGQPATKAGFVGQQDQCEDQAARDHRQVEESEYAEQEKPALGGGRDHRVPLSIV